MVEAGDVASSAFKAFEMVHETTAFYMFILEEAIQTVSLAIYLANRADNPGIMSELIGYNKNQLISDLDNITNGVGYLGYPMNIAFRAFAEASNKAMESYEGVADAGHDAEFNTEIKQDDEIGRYVELPADLDPYTGWGEGDDVHCILDKR